MAKRIKILIDPSGFDEGISYLIYRRKTPPLPDVPDTTPVLIEVNERLCKKRVVTKTGEVLQQMQEAPLQFKVSRVFQMLPTPKVYIDGVQVPNEHIILYPREKMIKIINEPILPNTSKVITMDYTYLASEVEDDPNIPQLGITHHGDPLDVVTGLRPPSNALFLFDPYTGILQIELIKDNRGADAYYKLELVEDKTGRKSPATPYKHIHIVPNDFDTKFVMEKSADGVNWEFVKEFTGITTTLSDPRDITNAGHISLNVDIEKIDSTSVKIILQNPWHNWENNLRTSNWFRFRTADDEGQASEWSIPMYTWVNYKPVKIKVRRKEHNGTPAEYEGFDAIDMWELTEQDVDPGQPNLILYDDHLLPGRNYSYTFYIDDEKGFRSLPFMETHQM